MKINKISSKYFAAKVLGKTSSFFSNIKKAARKDLEKMMMNPKKLVIWGRVQYFLDNFANSTLHNSFSASYNLDNFPKATSRLGRLQREINYAITIFPSTEIDEIEVSYLGEDEVSGEATIECDVMEDVGKFEVPLVDYELLPAVSFI